MLSRCYSSAREAQWMGLTNALEKLHVPFDFSGKRHEEILADEPWEQSLDCRLTQS